MTVNVKCVLCGKIFRNQTTNTDQLIDHLRRAHPELNFGSIPNLPADVKPEEEHPLDIFKKPKHDKATFSGKEEQEKFCERRRIVEKKTKKVDDGTCKCNDKKTIEEMFHNDRVTGLYIQSNICNKKDIQTQSDPCRTNEECNESLGFRSSIFSRSFFVDNCCLNRSTGGVSIPNEETPEAKRIEKLGGADFPNIKGCFLELPENINDMCQLDDEECEIDPDSVPLPTSCRIKTGISTQTARSKFLKECSTQTDTCPKKKGKGTQCQMKISSNKNKSPNPCPKVFPHGIDKKSTPSKRRSKDSCHKSGKKGGGCSVRISKNGHCHEFQTKYFQVIEKLLELEQLKTNIASELTQIDSEMLDGKKEEGAETAAPGAATPGVPAKAVKDAGKEGSQTPGTTQSEQLHTESVSSVDRAKQRLQEITDELQKLENIDVLYAEIVNDCPINQRVWACDSEALKGNADNAESNTSTCDVNVVKELILQDKIQHLESRLELAQKYLVDIAQGLSSNKDKPCPGEDSCPPGYIPDKERKEGGGTENGITHNKSTKNNQKSSNNNNELPDIVSVSVTDSRQNHLDQLERKLLELKRMTHNN